MAIAQVQAFYFAIEQALKEVTELVSAKLIAARMKELNSGLATALNDLAKTEKV